MVDDTSPSSSPSPSPAPAPVPDPVMVADAVIALSGMNETEVLCAFIVGLRAEDPRSRATGYTKLYGSTGCVRRYTCSACGDLLDTESAKWKPTRHAERACEKHIARCAEIARLTRKGIVLLQQAKKAGEQ